MARVSGVLALVGGAEWQEGCDFDRELLAASGAGEVVVVPTGAAYEHPDALVDTATRWFAGLGASVHPVMALDRSGANDAEHAEAVRRARLVYLAGGSAMHVRSTLAQTALWEALKGAWHSGATIAGTSAGAMALCDPMVDPRGGAFTLGLGLVARLAVIPHADTWSHDKLHRTLQLAPSGLPVVGVGERTALLCHTDGRWQASGPGTVQVWVDGKEKPLETLPSAPAKA